MATWLECFAGIFAGCNTPERAPGKRQGDRPSITGNILAHTQRTDFNRPEPQAALGPEQRGIYANPFSPPSLEMFANHLRSNTQQDTLLSSPDVCQAPKSILRSTSGGSGTPSVRSAVSDPSMRTAISNASTKSERSAESLKSDQKRASSQANDVKAKIDELERANRALEPQISHYQQIISNVESFEKKNKAMQEIKDRRVQQIDKQREIEKLRKSLGELNADIQTSKRLLRQNSIAKFDNLGHRTSPVVRSSSSLNRLLPSGSR